jgi:cytochrome c biogenesis protein CcdA/thiol-disulfide isomerase/thioredoxin
MDVSLIAVGVVAGLATCLSPCVLPVLPVVAAVSAQGGRRRPLGMAVGLAAAFTVFTLTASRLLSALGLPQDLLRNLGIALLAVVGLGLLVPLVGEWLGRAFAPVVRLAGSGGPAGDGFWSGVGVGVPLALVWTPCAGPILAAVTVLAAERRLSLELVLITLAYSIGAALPLFVIALLGNRAGSRLAALRQVGPGLRRASGVVLLLAAALFTTDIPTRLAASTPEYVSGLQRLERANGVRDDLSKLTDDKGGAPSAKTASRTPDTLKDYGPAPAFAGISTWINTAGGEPLTLRKLRGKVVLLDFWTYSCVNCIRTLPYLEAWDARYRKAGLLIVGVHTPEFAFEHVVSNVRRAVSEHDIRYPVAIDNDYATWNAWSNQYWPADYLIDRRGHVRSAHFGEGAYDLTEHDIRTLLGEPAEGQMARPANVVTPSVDVQTPETYLGTFRAAGYRQKLDSGREHDYGAGSPVELNEVQLAGRWKVQKEFIVAGKGAILRFRYSAPRIYLVAAPPAHPVMLGVAVDGRRRAAVKVARDDLYQLAHIAGGGSHLLALSVPAGTRLYSFTFG